MNPHHLLAIALDPARIFRAQGLMPDPWQREVLSCPSQYILLNCSRGAGKSRVTSALALHTALVERGSLVLLISRSQRQSTELLRYVKQGYHALGGPVPSLRCTETQVEFHGGSRVIALPAREETIRTFQGVRLLVLDEAARIPDALYGSVRPMTGTVHGRTVCLSTPFGQRGFFWRAWCDRGGPWQRFCIPWQQCPRLSAEFIDQERRQFGDSWIAQEYECSFTSCEGLVYPDFPTAVVRDWDPPAQGKRVGGIDWGFRNPFAALWGILDADDVLWIEAERYVRQATLRDHAAALPHGVTWYADPAGATEIHEFRAAGHTVLPGTNDIRAGIQAVTARLQTERLKVNGTRCPQLLAEARLYRYPQNPGEGTAEKPVDENNHALGALRYLVSRIDARAMARFRKQPPKAAEADDLTAAKPTGGIPWDPAPAKPTGGVPWDSNPDLWTRYS